MAEEANDDEGDNVASNSKSSMFDRLLSCISQQRPFVFNMIEKDETLKSSVFHRLRGGTNSLNLWPLPE